jgi:DNA-binding NarL/FixJ family response regulator
MNPFAGLAHELVDRPGMLRKHIANPVRVEIGRTNWDKRRTISEVPENPWRLHARHFDVLRMAAEGKKMAEIAEELKLSQKTIESHWLRALHLMGARNMVQAAVMFDRFERGQE